MKYDSEAFIGKKILVVGDVMLDEFVWGDAFRISPEAPVPVVKVERRTYAAGGAGNVAANIVSLGGQAVLGGFIGSDVQAEMLRQFLSEKKVAIEGLFVDRDRPTTTKTRILARGQQVVRVDVEERTTLSRAAEDRFVSWLEEEIPHADALVLSDYNKGLCAISLTQRVIALAREAGKPVVVDPKVKDFERYRGATVVTPNTMETVAAAGIEVDGLDALLQAAELLQKVLDGSALLVTRGREGMSLFEAGKAPLHIPAAVREVFDVTGAGDTVVSTLALALAAGWPLVEAVRIANHAAGIVVTKVGTATLTQAELRKRVLSEEPVSSGYNRRTDPA